ncbi:GAF domain-containing protein [Hymenobacter sp. B1770]|uniref:GAF domain-containing protein n=1 Tax=Hymenobacter sp. B1770 TaxID=1718788 RepID=UPI003CF1E260
MDIYRGLIPENDGQRLAALRAYNVLGTSPDGVFDEIVRLTAKLFGVPVALISLVEQDRVEFKANFGMGGVQQVPRTDSICSVAVLRAETTVFENLHESPCLLTNPAAAELNNSGFYAGHPLATLEGLNIGALCVLDRKPRTVTGPERERLATLAGLVVQLFDLRALLEQQPATGVVTWLLLYRSIEESLTRIDTLRELAQWEESDQTEAARRYRVAVDEEAERVLQALQSELASIRKHLG